MIITKIKDKVKHTKTIEVSPRDYDLAPQLYKEWVLGSGVYAGIVALNVTYFEEGSVLKNALLENIKPGDRTNTGKPNKSTLDKYKHIDNGGWLVRGADIFDPEGGKDGNFCQVKPNTPMEYVDKKSGVLKIIKYQTPANTSPIPIFLDLPQEIVDLIAERHNIPQGQRKRETESTWGWILRSDFPLIITEGAKKAGALLSQGVAAIALAGVNTGYRAPKDPVTGAAIRGGRRYLVPHLEMIANSSRFKNGREIIFCFDQDEKETTREKVCNAASATSRIMASHGARTNTIITWPFRLGKGVDDLLLQNPSAFWLAYENRQSVNLIRRDRQNSISKFLSRQINKQYLELDDLLGSEQAKVIALKSPKGTGKTLLIASTIERLKAASPDCKILNISHRRSLAQQQACKFKLHYAEDTNTDLKTNGVSVCVDSLLQDSISNVNPLDWGGAIIIIDEIDQVLWHTTHASTEIKRRRTNVLNNLRIILRKALSTGGKLIVADADLSPRSIDFIREIAGVGKDDFFVLENIHKPYSDRVVYYDDYKTPERIIDKAMEFISAGKKVLLQLGGQKVSSRWGTKTMERMVRDHFPRAKVIRVDAESVATPGHPAFKIMRMTQKLNEYDVVIASPVLETGVSLDAQDFYFDAVFGVGYGVNTVEGFCQSLERYRGNAPRFVWTSKSGLERINGGEWFPEELHQNLLRAEAGVHHLNNLYEVDWEGEDDELYEGVEAIDPEVKIHAMTFWCSKACQLNQDACRYRETVLHLLARDGYTVCHLNDIDELDGAMKDFNSGEISKVIKSEQVDEYVKAIAELDVSDYKPEDIETLKKKSDKSELERMVLTKLLLQAWTGHELACLPVVVEANLSGELRKAYFYYHVAQGEEFVARKDRVNRAKHRFAPDLVKGDLRTKIVVLEQVKLLDLIGDFTGKEINQDDLIDFHTTVIRNIPEIKTILGINVDKHRAITAFRSFLNLIGYKLVFTRRETKQGYRARFYRIEEPPEHFQACANYWYVKDLEAQQARDAKRSAERVL